MTTNPVHLARGVETSKLSFLAPWLSRLFMLPPMLIMVLIAVHYITNPTHGASLTGVALTTPEALTDTRVTGALALTVAFAIASSFASLRKLRAGHAIIIALMASILAVRMFGFHVDGTTLSMGDQRVKTIGESVFLVLNSFGLYLQTHLARETAK